MLNAEDNKLLTDISPGSPMGTLMRQYWMPVMLSEELPEADGNPVRLTVLCEDLVIFRDTGGRVGLFSEYCPHRRASLYYGRNEEGGLRCLYHGWKFDVTGQCLDMPNEPPESNFKNKLRQVAYPCREAAGMIWAYMGPRETPPPLPEFEWMSMPAEQRQISPFLRECNWMQALEGDIDTTHSGFLHSQLERGASAVNTWRREHPPRIEVVQTPAGTMYGGRYGEIEPDDPDGNATTYWRISQFMFPFHTLFPARPDGLVPGHIWVPLDNGNTMVYAMGWNPVRPMEERRRLAREDAPARRRVPAADLRGPRPMAGEGEPEQRLHAGPGAPAELELQRHPDGPAAGPGDDGAHGIPCSTARRSTWAPPTR